MLRFTIIKNSLVCFLSFCVLDFPLYLRVYFSVYLCVYFSPRSCVSLLSNLPPSSIGCMLT